MSAAKQATSDLSREDGELEEENEDPLPVVGGLPAGGLQQQGKEALYTAEIESFGQAIRPSLTQVLPNAAGSTGDTSFQRASLEKSAR